MKRGPGELVDVQGLLPPGPTIMHYDEEKIRPREKETFVDE